MPEAAPINELGAAHPGKQDPDPDVIKQRAPHAAHQDSLAERLAKRI
jgi:hypothetical protein